MQYHWKVGESKKSTDSSYEHHGRNHSLPMWLHLNIDITTTHHASSLHLRVSTEASTAAVVPNAAAPVAVREDAAAAVATPVKSPYKSPTTWPDGCITAKANILLLESKFATWSPTGKLHVLRNARTYHQDDINLQLVDTAHQPNVTSYTHSSHLSTLENCHGTQNHQGCHVIPQNEVL